MERQLPLHQSRPISTAQTKTVGEVVEKGQGFTRAYSVVNELPRTHESVIQHGNANVASGEKHTFGVKTVSPFR